MYLRWLICGQIKHQIMTSCLPHELDHQSKSQFPHLQNGDIMSTSYLQTLRGILCLKSHQSLKPLEVQRPSGCRRSGSPESRFSWRMFIRKCPWPPPKAEEGSRNGQREKLSCEAAPVTTSADSTVSSAAERPQRYPTWAQMAWL